MITLTIIFILSYAYSIYKIRKDSGSWKNFDPHDTNLFFHLIFIIETSILVIAIMTGLPYLAMEGIIP